MSKRFIDPALFGPWCLVLLIWQLTAPAYAQPKHRVALAEKNVLILHAFQSSLPANVKTDQGITSSLRSGGVDVKNQFFEYLDLARNPGPEHRKVLAELMRSRYSQQRIDLIITQYPEALQFLLNEGRTVFPEAPILALYLFSRTELPKTGRLIIQHFTNLDMIGTLESARKLVPGAKRVYVVGGVSSMDRTLENQARLGFKKWEGQLDFRYLSDMSFEDMLSEVSSAPPGTIVLFIALLADVTGKTYIPRDVVQRLSQVSKAPVFGLYNTLLGYGIAGGFLVDFEYIGAKAGELAVNILTLGPSPDKTSATLDVPPVPMFDWQQIRRWGFNETALPADAIILNKPVSAWERYKLYILGAVAFCLAETTLVIFLIVQRRRKKVAEAETARTRTELRHVERSSRMGELTASLAHEINQPLGAILSSAQAALRFLQSATPDLNLFRTILQNIVQDDKRAAGVITSLRSMLKREESRREPLNMNTLLDEVLNLFHSEAIVRNVTIERDIDTSLPPVLGDKIQLQQVVLNLIMNAAEAMSESPLEHQKRRIILRTRATDHGIQVAVLDFGPGIDSTKLVNIWQPFFTTKSTGLGMGLSVSRSIIQAHGGRISAESHPDGGAMFAFEIPIYESGK